MELGGYRVTDGAVLEHPGMSIHLSQYAEEGLFARSAIPAGAAWSGSPVRMPVSPEPLIAYGGAYSPAYADAVLAEKIIITPRRKSLGFVLTDVVFEVDVWNTYRTSAHTLTEIVVSGGGNVSVEGPLDLPIDYWPWHSRVTVIRVPARGDPAIKALIEYVFVAGGGPQFDGTYLTVDGMRIMLFSAEPDWSEPVRERTQYLTDIMTGYNGSEQRVSLRSRPRTRLAYRVLTVQPRDAAVLDALLYGYQGRIYGVPFWPDAQPLAQDVALGAVVLSVDTRYRRFAPGGLVAIWRDMHTWEAASALAVSTDSVTLTAPTHHAWPADGRTYVIPVLPGRLGETDIYRPTSMHAESDVVFECEVM